MDRPKIVTMRFDLSNEYDAATYHRLAESARRADGRGRGNQANYLASFMLGVRGPDLLQYADLTEIPHFDPKVVKRLDNLRSRIDEIARHVGYTLLRKDNHAPFHVDRSLVMRIESRHLRSEILPQPIDEPTRIFISLICGIPSRRVWFKPGLISIKCSVCWGINRPVMTQRYAHHYPESLRDGIDLLDRLAGQGTELVHPGQVSAVSGV